MRKSRLLALVVVLFAIGCGGGGSGDDGDDGDDGMPPDAPGPTADADPNGWQVLVEGDWELQPNEEGYFCVYATVPRDMYIKMFRPLIPNGTHHTVLTLFTGASPADGVYPCNAGTNGQSMIYGSGVGSPDFPFPPGVGLHLTAGQRLLLNLHLYNATDGILTGRSGTLFQEATAAEVQNEAELVLAGPVILNIPTGTSTQSGSCNLSNITSVPIQVFALSQHMHRLGTHMRSVVTRNGSPDIVLQDIDYAFESQGFQAVSPTIELRPGDRLTTYCTYDNTTGAPVSWGDSSNDEMCFTDLFYYPAQGADFICPF
jgi:hypothetical protein